MKKLLGVLVALLVINTTFGQQAGRFRYQMDFGTAVPKDGGIGAIVNIEPQVLVMNNMAIGMRMGVAGLAKDIVYYDVPDDYEGEIGANVSVLATANYYFNFGKGNVAPYMGVGYGYYSLSNIDIEGTDIDEDDIENLEADFAWAPMVRAGVELNKFRIGLEYNFVPKSNLQNVGGDIIGQATNEYFAFTLGFFVGGGRWGRGFSGASR